MALLRNYVSLWARSVRPFCTELHFNLDLTDVPKKRFRWTPRRIRLHSNLILNDRLKTNEPINHEDWITIRKELMNIPRFEITESTVDMTIVHLCIDNEKKETAMEYIQYLWDGDYDINLSSMIIYLKLCYIVKPNETQTKYLLNMYNKIRDKYPLLDALTAEYCIMAITQTNRWKESLELLDTIELTCKPRAIAYTAIISAAFDNNEPEIGWKYLREVLTRLIPGHCVYTAYLNYCTRNFKDAELQEEISKMFQFWGDRDIRPYVEVFHEYEKVLQASGWIVKRTSIQKFGVCRNCSQELISLKVTPEQYKKLTDTVRERVIIGIDVYRKTTPEELHKFLRFIEQGKPYDIVIDGLNVSYPIKSQFKPDGLQLTNVVKACVNMGKRVLVLGRKHMTKWLKLDIKYIMDHGSMFLAQNLSDDDPYLLYATLIKGPGTLFVSKDLMRQHKFLIEDAELKMTFKYWQMAHQVYPKAIITNQGIEVQLRNPPTYLPVAQKDDNGWHVPFTLESSVQPPHVYGPPRSWVCFRKSTSGSTDRLKKS